MIDSTDIDYSKCKTNRRIPEHLFNTIFGIDVFKTINDEYVTFPIIHTYKYHNLVSTTIFYLDESGEFHAEDVPLYEKKLIIT